MRLDTEDREPTPGGSFERRLRIELEQIARDMRAEHGSLQGCLEVIAKSARDVVPGTEDAGITLIARGRALEPRAATSDVQRKIDELQHRLGEGPCVQAIWEHETVLVTDMRTEQRWPGFAPEASRIGVQSMLAFQLYTTEDRLGALNLHSSRPNAFGDTSLSIGSTLSTHAAIALIASEREEQFRNALASRDIIGQAKGMLMQRYSIDAAQAFAILTEHSQHVNEPLSEVARTLVERGLPD